MMAWQTYDTKKTLVAVATGSWKEVGCVVFVVVFPNYFTKSVPFLLDCVLTDSRVADILMYVLNATR